MIDIAIQTADVGALNLLLTDDPSLATPGLVQLASQPPVAGPDTLRRMAELLLHAGTAALQTQQTAQGLAWLQTVLSASSALLCRFRILVIEFHSLDELWCESFFSTA